MDIELIVSEEELSSIKGGEWCYDEVWLVDLGC